MLAGCCFPRFILGIPTIASGKHMSFLLSPLLFPQLLTVTNAIDNVASCRCSTAQNANDSSIACSNTRKRCVLLGKEAAFGLPARVRVSNSKNRPTATEVENKVIIISISTIRNQISSKVKVKGQGVPDYGFIVGRWSLFIGPLSP